MCCWGSGKRNGKRDCGMSEPEKNIEAIYSDEKGRLTDRENAVHVELHEKGADGRHIRTVYGRWETPAWSDLVKETRRGIRVERIVEEIRAGLVWEFEKDAAFLAEIHEKHRDFDGLDRIMGALYKHFLRGGNDMNADRISALVRLSRYYKENIRDNSL